MMVVMTIKEMMMMMMMMTITNLQTKTRLSGWVGI
jgi:hypothetical protein